MILSLHVIIPNTIYSYYVIDYGFQPIEHTEEEGLHHEVDGDLSDWKSRITGGLDI